MLEKDVKITSEIRRTFVQLSNLALGGKPIVSVIITAPLPPSFKRHGRTGLLQIKVATAYWICQENMWWVNDARPSVLRLLATDPDMGVMWKRQLPPRQSGNLALIYPRGGWETVAWVSPCDGERAVGRPDPDDRLRLGTAGVAGEAAHRVGLEGSTLEQSGFDRLPLTLVR